MHHFLHDAQQLLEMWNAANATRSNLMMNFWNPHPLYTQYQGTEAEFHKVLLPSPTQACLDARILPGDRCWSECTRG